MAHRVGAKGQVVVDQKIRKALRIEPGAQTIQRVEGDRVEIRFLPAEHTRSLYGILARHVRRWPVNPDDTEDAWAEAAAEKYLEGLPQE